MTAVDLDIKASTEEEVMGRGAGLTDNAISLCDHWVAALYPKIGYSRKSHTVSNKARSNGIYRHNLEHIKKCLANGYSSDEIKGLLDQYRSNGHSTLQWVNKLLPVPKREETDNIIYLKEEYGHTHPDLFQNGKLIAMLEKKKLVDYLIGYLIGPTERESIRIRELGSLDYLLQNYTIDEVLYMADESRDSNKDIKSLLDIQEFHKEAQEDIINKKIVSKLIMQSIRESIGSA